jgi:hypothetical protein
MRNLSVSLRKRLANPGSVLRSSAATVAAGQPEQRRWELSRHSQPAGKPAETVLLLPRRPVRATSLPMANGLIGLGQGCDDLLLGCWLGPRRCIPVIRLMRGGPPDRRRLGTAKNRFMRKLQQRHVSPYNRGAGGLPGNGPAHDPPSEAITIVGQSACPPSCPPQAARPPVMLPVDYRPLEPSQRCRP